MLHVIGCITQQHDVRLVVLAALLCFCACFTAMSMIGRARVCTGWLQLTWLAGAAFSAGSGIWATHFVAMLAYRTSLPMGFDAGLTILSALAAIFFSGVGYYLSLDRPLLGGSVVGLGVGAMHYIGMAAVEIHADPIWNLRYVSASIVLGMAATSTAMKLARRGTGWRHVWAGAAVFTLAIVSVHFTAMAGLAYRPDPNVAAPEVVSQPAFLALAIAAVAFLLVALGLLGSLVDHHLERHALVEAQRLRRYVGELEETKRQLLIAKGHAEAGNRAKSSFLANMSHELRTPLNAIIGFTDMIRQETLGPVAPARYRDYIDDVHASGKHLLTLINDILDLAKIEAGRQELDEQELDIAGLMRQASLFVQPQATKSQVSVSCQVETKAMLWADRRSMVQILTNLVSNAVKYSPARGQVRLFARTNQDGSLAMGVEDDGPGMSEEGLKTAMEPFGQVASHITVEGRGTGLGLSIVKALVEAQGGMFHLESQINKGTRAWVEFSSEHLRAHCRAA